MNKLTEKQEEELLKKFESLNPLQSVRISLTATNTQFRKIGWAKTSDYCLNGSCYSLFLAATVVIAKLEDGSAECTKGYEFLNNPLSFGLQDKSFIKTPDLNQTSTKKALHDSTIDTSIKNILWWELEKQQRKAQWRDVVALRNCVRQIIGQ